MPEYQTHKSPTSHAGTICVRSLCTTVALSTLAFFLVLPRPALGVGGAVSVTDNRQTARQDSQTIETFSRRDVLSVGQRVPIGPRVSFDARFRSQRETSGTELDGVRLETERTTLQPSFLLSYDQPGLRVGATGSWLDRRVTADSGPVPDQTRYQLGATLRADPTRWTNVSTIWKRSVTEQTGGSTQDRENREHSVLVDLDQRLIRSWSFGYRFSTRSSNIVERDTQQLLRSHLVEFSGSPSLADDRLQTSLRARSQFFHQRVEAGTAGSSRVPLVPLAGSLTLDDTPEVLDPLEDDPVPVPGLLDGNLDDTTPIDIGDLASIVREFGGDYRNIAVDLGEAIEIAGALLYVDERLLLPELFDWQVFVTDDPDGRDWTEVPEGDVSVSYQEFGGIRQGWEVAFLTPQTSRWFKMVDVKLGQTIPHLYITELELFREESTEVSETTEDPRIHRADATVSYQVSSRLRVGAQSSVRRRTFDDESENLDEISHGLSSQWKQGRFLLSARYGINRLWADRRTNTDVVDYGVTARQRFGYDVTTTLAWSRTKDMSASRDRITDGVSFVALWNPTRRLRVTQRIARSARIDDVAGEESESIVASTSFHGSPFLSLTFDLDRTDRWVDQEAGAGFERFNDTSLTSSWTPVPLVSLSSYVAFQERRTEEWIVRNSLSWTPFPGGRTELRFSGSTFSDTRTDNTRYSAQAAVRWRVHPRVIVDGSVESSRVELSEETTTPVSTRVHVVWSF